MEQHFAMTAGQNALPTKVIKQFDKIALIDADSLKYLVCNDIFKMLQNNKKHANINIEPLIEKRLQDIYDCFNAKGMIFCFSGKSFNTFRAKVAIDKEYKGNRTEDKTFYDCKIEDMYRVVKYIMERNNTLLYDDLEADDILSMLQCEETFIWSKDKDLLQIPGWHYDFTHGDLYYITEEQALKNLCYQLIKGDTVDYIRGLPKWGDVKASNFINACTSIKSLPSKILLEYQKIYGITAGTDAFVETWNLIKLRMNRGNYFTQKYSSAFSMLNFLKSQ